MGISFSSLLSRPATAAPRPPQSSYSGPCPAPDGDMDRLSPSASNVRDTIVVMTDNKPRRVQAIRQSEPPGHPRLYYQSDMHHPRPTKSQTESPQARNNSSYSVNRAASTTPSKRRSGPLVQPTTHEARQYPSFPPRPPAGAAQSAPKSASGSRSYESKFTPIGRPPTQPVQGHNDLMVSTDTGINKFGHNALDAEAMTLIDNGDPIRDDIMEYWRNRGPEIPADTGVFDSWFFNKSNGKIGLIPDRLQTKKILFAFVDHCKRSPDTKPKNHWGLIRMEVRERHVSVSHYDPAGSLERHNDLMNRLKPWIAKTLSGYSVDLNQMIGPSVASDQKSRAVFCLLSLFELLKYPDQPLPREYPNAKEKFWEYTGMPSEKVIEAARSPGRDSGIAMERSRSTSREAIAVEATSMEADLPQVSDANPQTSETQSSKKRPYDAQDILISQPMAKRKKPDQAVKELEDLRAMIKSTIMQKSKDWEEDPIPNAVAEIPEIKSKIIPNHVEAVNILKKDSDRISLSLGAAVEEQQEAEKELAEVSASIEEQRQKVEKATGKVKLLEQKVLDVKVEGVAEFAQTVTDKEKATHGLRIESMHNARNLEAEKGKKKIAEEKLADLQGWHKVGEGRKHLLKIAEDIEA